jgi:hypothetical protein
MKLEMTTKMETTSTTSSEGISRRLFVRNAALAGTALAGLVASSGAQEAGSGSHSNSAISGIPGESPKGASADAKVIDIKIKRAMLSGPISITKDATVVEMDEAGSTTVLRKGTNEWVCFPGNENRVGDPPMCADRMAMQWFMDAHFRKPKPTNQTPGICYMLCGATQHSNTDATDNTSPAIPIGPHWMIMWPFNAETSGLPTTVRDAGAWVMFNDTPYAYLHICGTPWTGNEYQPEDTPIWTMRYGKSEER